mmetsp:Transcript_12929/g.51777  ORF Transcript_12929/g.51777 Transcript_12929/m.51777 type:complete len:204 (+) Transcript_12929:1-612(+)
MHNAETAPRRASRDDNPVKVHPRTATAEASKQQPTSPTKSARDAGSASARGGSSRAAEEPEVEAADHSDAAIASSKQETAAKENRVREALEASRKRVREEAERLERVESELRKLSAQEQADIGILRGQLEDIDRQLVWLERDYRSKEAAFHKAKSAYEGMQQRKRALHEHLAIMVLSSEKRKEEKLTDLLAKMEAPGGGGGGE